MRCIILEDFEFMPPLLCCSTDGPSILNNSIISENCHEAPYQVIILSLDHGENCSVLIKKAFEIIYGQTDDRGIVLYLN